MLSRQAGNFDVKQGDMVGSYTFRSDTTGPGVQIVTVKGASEPYRSTHGYRVTAGSVEPISSSSIHVLHVIAASPVGLVLGLAVMALFRLLARTAVPEKGGAPPATAVAVEEPPPGARPAGVTRACLSLLAALAVDLAETAPLWTVAFDAGMRGSSGAWWGLALDVGYVAACLALLRWVYRGRDWARKSVRVLVAASCVIAALDMASPDGGVAAFSFVGAGVLLVKVYACLLLARGDVAQWYRRTEPAIA